MPVSPEARALYHPLPPGAEALGDLGPFTAALDDCDPDGALAALAGPDEAAREALAALVEVARARWEAPGASLSRAQAHAAAALRLADTPLGHMAAGLAAAWAVRTPDAAAHLTRVVDACGQPFAAEILAQIRIDEGDVAGAVAALDRVPASLRGLRGLGWARARALAAGGEDAKAGVLVCDLLTSNEIASDATGLDVVLHELGAERRRVFLRNVHAKTASPLARGRLCHAEALAGAKGFAAIDRVGARRFARAVLAVLFPTRAPPPALVVVVLLLFAPAGILRLLLLPLPLHRYLVAHARAVAATGQNRALDLPTNGLGPLCLLGVGAGTVAAALLHHPIWLAVSAASAVALAIRLLRIEARLPSQ